MEENYYTSLRCAFPFPLQPSNLLRFLFMSPSIQVILTMASSAACEATTIVSTQDAREAGELLFQ